MWIEKRLIEQQNICLDFFFLLFLIVLFVFGVFLLFGGGGIFSPFSFFLLHASKPKAQRKQK